MFSSEMDLHSLILQINPEMLGFMTRLILTEICEVSMRRSRDHNQGFHEEWFTPVR